MTTMQANMNPAQMPIGSGDRLGLTVFFALVIHSLLILGISFDIIKPQRPAEKLPGLEITLVQSKSEKKIKDADFRAQANQEGGGDSKQKERPAAPAQPLVQQQEVMPVQQPRQVPPQPPAPQPVLKPRPPEPAAAPPAPVQEVITAAQAPQKVASTPPAPKPEPKQQTRLSAAQLLSRSRQIASLAAEIDQTQRLFAQRPKRKVISARTSEYRFSSYEEAWRQKVERIGRINFPDEAKRRQLSGKLIMAVTLKPDGSIQQLEIRQPSRHKILDDAALRIVRLAAPYAPFSKEMRKDTDELVIIRTWIFEAGKSFSAR